MEILEEVAKNVLKEGSYEILSNCEIRFNGPRHKFIFAKNLLSLEWVERILIREAKRFEGLGYKILK